MENSIKFYDCKHKFVEPETKRLLLGISNNNYTFQTIILPYSNVCSEIFYSNEEFTCGIRWNSEHNRKVAAWYKNLKFECNITKKDNWNIINCKDQSTVCFMYDFQVYKNLDEYNKLNPKNSTLKENKKTSIFEDDRWKEIFEEYDQEDKQLVDIFIEKHKELYNQIQNKER